MAIEYIGHIMLIHSNDDKVWMNKNREIHREDGPAIMTDNGKYGWYLNGKRVTKEDVLNTPDKLQKWNVEDLLLKL